MNPALIVPAVLMLIGGFLIVTGLSTDTIGVFGTTVNSKFITMLGGIGMFGAVLVAAEILTRKKRDAQRLARRAQREASDSQRA